VSSLKYKVFIEGVAMATRIRIGRIVHKDSIICSLNLIWLEVLKVKMAAIK
jgi:hypothetical protein